MKTEEKLQCIKSPCMTPEAQRIAIAKACGWKQPFGATGDWERPDGSMTRTCRLPDYLNDLNAMHEAEKVLSLDNREHYWNQLNRVCERAKRMAPVAQWLVPTATAAQRAEAFLRTLKLYTNE